MMHARNRPRPAGPGALAEALSGMDAPVAHPGREPKIHILSVAKFPLGGIRTYLKYTYGNLDREKYRVTIAAVRFPEVELILQDLAGLAVDLHGTDESAGNRGLLQSTYRLLHSGRTDIIHSQGLTAGIVAILANWRLRIPHVITHHDVFRPDQFRAATGRLKKSLMAAVLARADCIVCVTEDARRNFEEYLPTFPAEKLKLVSNGIDCRSFAEVASQRRSDAAAASPADSPFTFGFFGRFMPQKGFDVLIDAVAELVRGPRALRPFRILAVNHGDCIGRYKTQIARLGLDGWFSFPGFRDSVAELLRDLDCVVMPSRWEAAGLVAMEALAAGCPLIASDCPGLREVTCDSPALVAMTESPSSLAQQMRNAMEGGAWHRRVFREFSKVALSRYDARRTADEMEAIFAAFLVARTSSGTRQHSGMGAPSER